MNYQDYIVTISSATLATGMSLVSAHNAIASEVSHQGTIQSNLGTYRTFPQWGQQGQYHIAKTELNLSKFCANYPYNSRCKEQDIPEVEQENVLPSQYSRSASKTNWSVVPNIGTLGLGGAVVGKITPQLNARAGVNTFGFNIDYEETRASYDSDVSLFNIATALDYYPFKNSGFNASLGVIYNNNNADGVATASDIIDVDLGGFNVDVNDLLSVNAKVSSSRNFAPYLGLGWGNPISGGLKFWGNVGVMFPGSPDVELSPNFQFNQDLIPDDIQQDIQDSLEEEETAIENDLERFNVYPIVSLGLSYSF